MQCPTHQLDSKKCTVPSFFRMQSGDWVTAIMQIGKRLQCFVINCPPNCETVFFYLNPAKGVQGIPVSHFPNFSLLQILQSHGQWNISHNEIVEIVKVFNEDTVYLL